MDSYTDGERAVNQRRAAGQKAAEARAKTQPAPKPWQAKRHAVRLAQDKRGEWWIYAESGAGIPATDFEVSLWLDLCECRQALGQAMEAAHE